MNINLANIDFAPGQGGGGEAVIRTLNVTENGTYSAPSGVDGFSPVNVNVSSGGSVTPEEQAALDTLVNSSEGALYTKTFERYHQSEVVWPDIINADAASVVFWDDLYIIYNGDLYKLNRESYQFDMINHIEGIWAGASFFEDKSGRYYCDGRELDLENGTIGETQINMPGYYRYGLLQNIFYGEYGVWILSSSVFKFNESSQVFEEMTLNSTFGYGGSSLYSHLFKYDGHILGVYNNLTFEVTEYEDHIDVADVTNVYFNMPTFSTSAYDFKMTKDGDLYYIDGYNVHIYDESLSDWVNSDDVYITSPIYGHYAAVSDNIVFSFYNEKMYCMNLGADFNSTSWTKISNVAVDLTSNQKISGIKEFTDDVITRRLFVNGINSYENVNINVGNNDVNISGKSVVFVNNQNNETIIKNGTKRIATVDQTFVNSTFIPYGQDGDNIGHINGDSESTYNFNTYTNRMFKKYGSDWYEFDGTSTLIPVSFGLDINGNDVFNSPNATIMIIWDGQNETYNTYMWNDANTRWDLICSSNQISTGYNIWFDGDNFRYANTYKLAETGGVWSWDSDPLVNDIWSYSVRFGYKNGEVYAYDDNDWHLYKYDKVNCTLDQIGFLNAGYKLYSYFDEMFFRMNGNEVYIIDLSKVDPQDPDASVLGDMMFNISSNSYAFVGATDRLWYYNTNNEMCSSYQKTYETPEVPASNGTYVLKATRVGNQITYEWIPDNI